MDRPDDEARQQNLKELGEFLRARRRTISPELRGIVTARRRLIPGLSRYEAASFANIGSSWYARLEAGRISRPTITTMSAVSRALQLTPDETAYTFRLAGIASAAIAPERAGPKDG